MILYVHDPREADSDYASDPQWAADEFSTLDT